MSLIQKYEYFSCATLLESFHLFTIFFRYCIYGLALTPIFIKFSQLKHNTKLNETRKDRHKKKIKANIPVIFKTAQNPQNNSFWEDLITNLLKK